MMETDMLWSYISSLSFEEYCGTVSSGSMLIILLFKSNRVYEDWLVMNGCFEHELLVVWPILI